MKWEHRLIAEAKIADKRGEILTYISVKRGNTIKRRIYRRKLVFEQEEEYFEEEED